jgi:hypothetical protein
MNAKLTKEYYFPIVKGSQFGMIKIGHAIKSAFVKFIEDPKGGWLKIMNFHPTQYLNSLIAYKTSIHFFGKEYKAAEKGNKYLKKQYKRMAIALSKGDKERYFAIGENLTKRSSYFQMALFVNKIRFYPNNYTIGKVWKFHTEIRNILQNEKSNLKFRRIFLPEYNADGTLKKYRPLGVPSVVWRVVAASYEFLLVNLLKNTWEPNQYGGMPKVGVVDAWIDILRDIGNYKTIVGIDLAKFFDTVYLKAVDFALKDEGVPSKIIEIIHKINLNKPIIKPEDRKIERDRIKSVTQEAPIKLKNNVVFNMTNERDRSLPQGLNTSPLLSQLVLNKTNVFKGVAKYERVIHYVDDAVILSTHGPKMAIDFYKEALKTSYNGITISEKKTEIIRSMDYPEFKITWKKPLKFLGCEYDGQTFRANTRKGGVFEVTDASTKIQEIIRWLELNRNSIANYPRRDLSKLINESWNHMESWKLLDPNKDLTDWERNRIIRTKVLRGTVEDKVIELYRGSYMPYILGSTNSSSMLCAGTVLLCYKRGKGRPKGSKKVNSFNHT